MWIYLQNKNDTKSPIIINVQHSIWSEIRHVGMCALLWSLNSMGDVITFMIQQNYI